MPSKSPREPRVMAFIATRGVLGFVAGSGVFLLTDDNGQYSARTAVGYLAVFGMLLGALLGTVVAALLAGRRR